MSHDQLHVFNHAAAQQVDRRIFMIEHGVMRSPRSPDFEELEVLLASDFDHRAQDFDKYSADIQQSQATIAKQGRLRKEEADKKRRDRNVGAGKLERPVAARGGTLRWRLPRQP